MRSPRPTRYTVYHYHQAYPGYPVERASVSYGAANPEAFKWAINTAFRYSGDILAEYDDGSASLIKRHCYRDLADKPTPTTCQVDMDTGLAVAAVGSSR